MNLSGLQSKSDKALYGLLLTQALDKNHLKPTGDSLIASSVEYYRHNGNDLNKIKSIYYQGRVYLHRENNPMALVCFFKVKDMAESSNEYFWASLACRGISDIYNTSFNTAEELKYARMEYDYMKRSGIQPYLNYALLDLGRALFNNNDTAEALSVVSQLADSAKKCDDAYLDYCALQLKVRVLTVLENVKDGLPAAIKLCANEYAESADSVNLALIMTEAGNPEDAIDMINKVSEPNAETEMDVRYNYAYKKKNYKEAIECLMQINYINAETVKNAVNQNLSGTIADYFELSKKTELAEIKASQAQAWLLALSSVFILGIAVLIITIAYRRQKRNIADKIMLAEQLRESLERSKSLLDESKYKLDESRTRLYEQDTLLTEKDTLLNERDTLITEKNRQLAEKDHKLDEATAMMEDSLSRIQILISSKYELLNKLSMVVYAAGSSKKAESKIADTVTQIINELKVSKKGLEKLENELNSNCNNLMHDFRRDLPGLKEIDYLLYLFTALNFSIPVISLFLKEERIESIYNRKRRLKDRISKLSDPQKDRYMAHLS